MGRPRVYQSRDLRRVPIPAASRSMSLGFQSLGDLPQRESLVPKATCPCTAIASAPSAR
jgi:hypothetical protein